MAGFADLLDPLYDPHQNQTAEPHVVGTSLAISVTVLDGDDDEVDLSSGYTASWTPYVKRNALTTFTSTLISGRQVVLGDGVVTVSATPAASLALFVPYARLVAVHTLVVTRTSDGASVPLWHDCYLPLRPRLNP